MNEKNEIGLIGWIWRISFSLLLGLLMMGAILCSMIMAPQKAHGQAAITSYFAAPQQPNGGYVDTNDFPLTITNGGMTLLTQTTNVANNVFVIRQNVGLSLFATLQVTNTGVATTNGYVLFWVDTSADGTSNTITGETNGVWDGQISHGFLFYAYYTAMPQSTDTFVLWTNIPNTSASNIRDARISGVTNSLPIGVWVKQFVWSQSWQ